MNRVQRVQILLYEGADELDVVGPFEILAAAGFATELVTVDDARSITTAHGIALAPHTTLDVAPDLLVVPGGNWVTRAARGAWAECERGVLPRAIAERHAAGSTIAGVCTGVMLLAAGGLLSGRPAVTHRAALDDLRATGADVRAEARVVDDGDVLTAGGVTSGLDLALHLVARERGEDAARAGAQRIEHDRRGSVLLTQVPA